MRHLFLKTVALFHVVFGLSASCALFLLLVDMLDGRQMHLRMSPYYHANTDTSVVALVIILMLMGLTIMASGMFLFPARVIKPAPAPIAAPEAAAPANNSIPTELSQMRVVAHGKELFLVDLASQQIITNL